MVGYNIMHYVVTKWTVLTHSRFWPCEIYSEENLTSTALENVDFLEFIAQFGRDIS